MVKYNWADGGRDIATLHTHTGRWEGTQLHTWTRGQCVVIMCGLCVLCLARRCETLEHARLGFMAWSIDWHCEKPGKVEEPRSPPPCLLWLEVTRSKAWITHSADYHDGRGQGDQEGNQGGRQGEDQGDSVGHGAVVPAPHHATPAWPHCRWPAL